MVPGRAVMLTIGETGVTAHQTILHAVECELNASTLQHGSVWEARMLARLVGAEETASGGAVRACL